MSHYAIAPNAAGLYQLRRIYRRLTPTGPRLDRIEIMEETFPMNAQGRKDAQALVDILNSAKVAA